jgi:hypothetical protein
VWGLVAEKSGLVGAWQLMSVCRAARAGAKEFLSRLPGLVVCGGHTAGASRVRDVWRLDLATMRWEPMPVLVDARSGPACCVVRGALVVLSGGTPTVARRVSVEMLSSQEEEGAFVGLPPLSCGGMWGAAAIAVEESDSASGQVLLLGGVDFGGALSTVHLVDLATGACVPQNNLLHSRAYSAVGRLPNGRIVCAGGFGGYKLAEVWEPPTRGAVDASWSLRELPAMSAELWGCCGCVMSDGRFAVLGGTSYANNVSTTSCEALVVDGDAHWEPLPPMHESRGLFACGAVAGCVIVAGGRDVKSAEVYDEELNRWLRLPCDLPYESSLYCMGSVVL